VSPLSHAITGRRRRRWLGHASALLAIALSACGDDLVLPTGPPGTVAVTGGGDGSGAVRSQADLEPAIDCDVRDGVAVGSACTAEYPPGTRVVLEAEAAAGSRFLGWAGACTGTGECVLAVDEGPPVTATFAAGVANLTVVGAGTGNGSGTVESEAGVSPAIDCTVTGGATGAAGCTATYPPNTSVTLTASPAAGSVFLGWGGACSGTGACTVVTDQPRIVAASFAPEPGGPARGAQLSFATDRSGNWDIYIMNADGSGQAPLIATSRDETRPAWSADGSRIAFDRLMNGNNTDIFVADADGRNERRLTTRNAAEEDPSWSPDGTKIVYVAREGGQTDLWIMNADGSGARQLTSGAGDDTKPAWSPDGSTIAFESDRHGNAEVYTVPASGGTPVRLTNAALDDGYPTWSADGRQIAFVKNSDPQNWDIWVMNADGTGQRRVTTDIAEDYDADWSRDGDGIAFTSRPRGSNYDIWIVNPSDGSPVNRTGSGSTERYPAWRPR
jgi:TolB protein